MLKVEFYLKLFIGFFITKTGYWIFLTEKTLVAKLVYYWIRLHNFRTDFFGIGLIISFIVFLFSFLKVLKALYLWEMDKGIE